MGMDFAYWRLHADGVFLNIHINRDRKRMAPHEPGAYLLAFSLVSKEGKARSHFQGEKDRANWKDLWVDKIKELKKDRKSTRLNSSHVAISYAVFCLKKKKK